MTFLILGIVIFLGIHLIKSFVPAVRETVVQHGSLGLWRALHGMCALVGLCLIAYGFQTSRATTGILYTPPVFLAHITLLLMLIATICLVSAWLPAGRIRTATKHPAVLAIKIWALSHLLANGETNSVLLFTTFLAWGVILRITMKRRARAGLIEYPEFQSFTYDILSVIIGLAVYFAFLFRLHEWLIGVSPIVMG